MLNPREGRGVYDTHPWYGVIFTGIIFRGVCLPTGWVGWGWVLGLCLGGGLSPGGSLSMGWGGSLSKGESSRTVTSRRYASYSNAFFLSTVVKISINCYSLSTGHE